jgi:cation:H+ antiporter
MGLLPQRNSYAFLLLFLFAGGPIRETSPATILWTAPAILISALLIAWAAESAQFFMAQGFALAILAWLQTLPEFAVEGVLAWHQQTPLLLAGLTGALRLLTGLGWPVIYFTAAIAHRRRNGKPLRAIHLEEHHSVEVIGLLLPLIYMAVVAAKGSVNVFDAAVLILIYAAYLALLTKLPPEAQESVEELEMIPRAIVKSPRTRRIAIIAALFAVGGFFIFYTAEPFVASLLAISGALGISTFIFVQWVAPVVSEFPEMASTIYFARTIGRAPMALMNMVSSNINQWTLLVAMLPIVFSISAGAATPIVFDEEQQVELLMTLGQALVGLIFLVNMELAWWEATVLFVLYTIPFISPTLVKPMTVVYFGWAGVEMFRMAMGKRQPAALVLFIQTWKEHVTRRSS